MSEDETTAADVDLDRPASLRLSRAIDTGQIFVTELLRRESRAGEQPPDRPTRPYRAIATVVGLILLIAVLTVSVVATSGQHTVRAAPSSFAPSDITGANALRPELINSSVRNRPPAADDRGQQPAGTGQAAVAPPRLEPAAPSGGVPQSPPAAAPQPPANLVKPAPATVPPPPGSIADIVTAFYETAPVAPLRAFDMLDPVMQGSGYAGFQQAWAGIARATVDDIRPDGPDAAWVIVSLVRRDDTVLRTLQRIAVTPGPQPRITGAQLLSASQTGNIADRVPAVEGPNLRR